MKQKILLFISSIISQITIVLGVSTVLLFLNNINNVVCFTSLGVFILLLIINGLMGIRQNTITELVNKPEAVVSFSSSKTVRAEELQEKFFEDIMEYCQSIGLNPSVSTETGTAMLVNIKGDDMQDIMPLSLPEDKILTEKNYNEYLQYIKEQIDTEKLKLNI